MSAYDVVTARFARLATVNEASAMLGWMFFDWLRGHKPSALGACIGEEARHAR